MGKQDLWRAYCTSHAVLDQFILPALGGVGFEALTLGCRLITRTDQETLGHFFGAAPSVLPAATINEVARSMESVIEELAIIVASPARIFQSSYAKITPMSAMRRTQAKK